MTNNWCIFFLSKYGHILKILEFLTIKAILYKFAHKLLLHYLNTTGCLAIHSISGFMSILLCYVDFLKYGKRYKLMSQHEFAERIFSKE